MTGELVRMDAGLHLVSESDLVAVMPRRVMPKRIHVWQR